MLNTVAVAATTGYLRLHPPTGGNRVDAVVHGFATATGWAAAALVALATLRAPRN